MPHAIHQPLGPHGLPQLGKPFERTDHKGSDRSNYGEGYAENQAMNGRMVVDHAGIDNSSLPLLRLPTQLPGFADPAHKRSDLSLEKQVVVETDLKRRLTAPPQS